MVELKNLLSEKTVYLNRKLVVREILLRLFIRYLFLHRQTSLQKKEGEYDLGDSNLL